MNRVLLNSLEDDKGSVAVTTLPKKVVRRPSLFALNFGCPVEVKCQNQLKVPLGTKVAQSVISVVFAFGD